MSMNYVLGVDIDNCLANYNKGLKDYLKRQDHSLTDDDFPEVTDYSFVKSGWFDTVEDYLAAHNNAVECGLFRCVETMPGAPEAIRKLADEGVRIRIVTHRLLTDETYARVAADTALWLDTHRIPFHDLCFTSHKNDITCDGFIDDAPSNIDSIVSRNSAYCFAFDHPYNKNTKADDRIYDWEDAVKKVLAHRSKLEKLNSKASR